MPDVFYQLFMSSALVVEQGVTNGNLIALDPYITPEIMPNLSRIYEAYPEYKTTITAGDGHIYSLGIIQNANSPLMTFYYNQRWLDDAGPCRAHDAGRVHRGHGRVQSARGTARE